MNIILKAGRKKSETNLNFPGFLHMYFCFGMISALNYIWEWYVMRFSVRDSQHLNLALSPKIWKPFRSWIGHTGYLQCIH